MVDIGRFGNSGPSMRRARLGAQAGPGEQTPQRRLHTSLV